MTPLPLDPRIHRYKGIALGAMSLCTLAAVVLWGAGDLPAHEHEVFQRYVGLTSLLLVLAAGTTLARERLLSAVRLPLLASALRWLPELLQLLVFLFWVPGMITIADYLVMPSSLALADRWLAAPETALGLTHATTYPWFERHGLVEPLAKIYALLDPEVKLLAVYLLLLRRDLLRLWQYTACLSVAGVASVPMLWAFPATGPTLWFEGQYSVVPPTPSWVGPLLQLREGVLGDPTQVAGLLSCPSFHTVFALYLARAWSDAPRPLFALALMVNGLVVLSTVPVGAHYLSDVAGGVLWAVLWAKLVDRWASSPNVRPTNTGPS